jgi:hypothetical protein
MKKILTTVLLTLVSLFLFASALHAQIFGPEGMNIPGAFNGWSNPPSVNAFAGIQVPGGTFLLDTLIQARMYRTVIHVAASGADAVGGTYNYLFTSGPVGNYYQNKWNGTSTVLDSVQSYTYSTGAGTDNNITIGNGRYYTVNVLDNGYASTQAIWIETASPPVQILSVSQTPAGSTVPPSMAVTVSLRTSGTPTASENFYVRYSTDNFLTSTLAPVTFVSPDSGTAGLPGFGGGETVRYYPFSTKAVDPVSQYEVKALSYNAGPGGQGFGYVVFASTLTISATAGPHGSITPSGNVTVASGDDQSFSITPDPGYFIDSVIVDNVFAGTSGTYDFTNVVSNHTIRAVFSKNVNVTFQVDMRVMAAAGSFGPSTDSVWVRGTFNGWESTLLGDANLDTVYSVTIPIEQFSPVAYKFFKTLRGGLEWEDHVANRSFATGAVDTTLGVVYFDDQFPLFNVTFQVDMRNQLAQGFFRPDLGDVLTVRGSFNDWGNSTLNPDTLIDGDTDSIYVRTVAIPGNQELQYKFWKTLRGGFDYEPGDNRVFAHGLQHDVIAPVEFKESFVAFNVVERWNLVSVPVTVTDYTKASLFPSSVSPAFGFESGYSQRDTLEIGKGYWLKFGAAQALEIPGTPVVRETIDVKSGWNLVGSLAFPVQVAGIVVEPSGIISSPFYGYEPGYAVSTQLQQGRGYWVKVSADGQLHLDTAVVSGPESTGDVSRASHGRLIIRDATGNMQTLYLAGEQQVPGWYDLPPVPPEGSFDVRFSTGRMLERISGEAIGILVSSVYYPLVVSWDMSSTEPIMLMSGSTKVQMTGSGSVQVRNAGERISVYRSSEAGIPSAYALDQNYPNPFNPTTVISYEVPEVSYVKVGVFNVLGQRVASLVDGVVEAGRHTVQWDAMSPSGLYFLRMVAQSENQGGSLFSGEKKMLILK